MIMRNYALHQAQQREFLPEPGIVVRLWRNLKTRSQAARIADLDDDRLCDIGLSRACADAAPRWPF